tara:strand:+ start:71 stop:1948 length:1878 start_codon:yes stop_codon:yes gene_type:complete
MAQFGKADIGLIKATAGAEQSKFVDDNLMTGMAVSGFVDELNKKAQVQAGIQAGIKKDIDDKFGTTSANLPDQFSNNLLEFVPGMKNSYAGVKGNDIMGKHKQSQILTNHDDYLVEVEGLVGTIKANADGNAVNGVGHNAKSSYYLDQMKAENYQVFTAYDKDGKPSPNVAVPMKTEPRLSGFEFEYNGTKMTLADLKGKTYEGEEGRQLAEASEKAYQAYSTADEGYNEWNSLDDKIDGRPNPAKYQIYNSKTIPSRESNKENASAELGIYMKNVSELSGDSDHNNIGDAGMYGKQWKNQVDGYSGLDLQHTLFTDASDDDVDNSYGDLFVNQTSKDPNMYKNNKDEFISFNVGNGKSIQYGDDDWNMRTEAEQKSLLEMHIRGGRTDGSYNPDENSDFHKDGYANFMGNVTRDAALIKQRNYFENKGMFFDNGDGNPVNSAEVQMNRKQIAYTDHKFDAAFPERLLGGDNFNENLTASGSIGKALLEEFPEADLSFVGGGMIEIDGVETPFDLNGPNKKQELKRLKEHLQDYQLTDVENSLAGNMSNSTKDEDWKKMRRKGFNYHPHGQTTSEYLQFEGSDGNLVTGKLQVNGYDEETKMWKVTDTNGVAHEVDEDTLYPKGI